MAYVKFAAYNVHMLHVHQCLTNHEFTVFSQQNKHATNLSSIVRIGQFWVHMSLIMGETEKYTLKENGQKYRIMFRIMLILHTNM